MQQPFNTEPTPNNEAWVRQQYLNASYYLAERGIVTDSVSMQESRYLPPFLAIWKLNDQQKQSYWVITGDFPTDAVATTAAKTAREAIKHFSLRWQLKAEQLLQGAGAQDADGQKFAEVLVRGAENLYQVADNDQLWPEVG